MQQSNILKIVLCISITFCFCGNSFALATIKILEKKYYYEIRCTCGLLFDIKETDCAKMNGLVSHTMCYDCFLKSIEGYFEFKPSKKLLDNLYFDTERAKAGILRSA